MHSCRMKFEIVEIFKGCCETDDMGCKCYVAGIHYPMLTHCAFSMLSFSTTPQQIIITLSIVNLKTYLL